jgi:hypothetical protein
MHPMTQIAPPLEYHLILKIANRAVNELGDYPKLEALMDINAVHVHACKLDLEGLLHAPLAHFLHDIAGMRAKLDRETCKLADGWTPRFAAPADERCTCCQRLLKPATTVWLDLNLRTLEYRLEPWPESESQGLFAFGAACAKRVLANGGRVP